VYESFPGKLTLHDGSIVGAVLTIGDDVLTISAEGITVGTWPLKYCRVARQSDTEFQIAVDGEPTSFRPAEPAQFAQVAAQQFRASSLADRIDVIRAMPPAVDFSSDGRRGPRIPLDMPRLPIVLGVVVLAVAGLVTIAGLDGTGPADEETARDGIPSAADPVAAPPGLAAMSIPEFTVRWNIRAFQLGHPDLKLDGVPGEPYEHPFDDFLRLAVGGDAEAVADVVVTIDTAGNENQRLRGYHALEVAVAVARPGSSSDQRRALLAELGVSPSLDVPAGVSDVVRDGIEYVVSHVEGLTELTFEMGPA
jgi:hypothetical protein